ncbi:SCO family protein [Mesobaculum littorinae]|uniref:SCO family protein n=1 Tax=Mesobaculum littorinae TaxID=2486419 RepID=A0A438AH51_9RHOB|nr:SCO family protein [Mesobaculum littorinae]RVV97994.1 SCO family protein [Mesobaculum littorinae]
MPSRSILVAGAAAAALVLAGGVAWWALGPAGDDRFAGCGGAQVAGGAGAIGGPFELVSETGETVTSDDVIDAPTLVYFGYTFCPDVCPFDAARNAEAVDLLEERGHEVKPVFITIDPERDTPEVLAEYTDYLHPRMLGLTGSESQVQTAVEAYKVYRARREGADPDYYLMDHTAYTYLMLPGTGFVDFFRGAPSAERDGLTAEAMAEDVACYLDAAG